MTKMSMYTHSVQETALEDFLSRSSNVASSQQVITDVIPKKNIIINTG